MGPEGGFLVDGRLLLLSAMAPGTATFAEALQARMQKYAFTSKGLDAVALSTDCSVPNRSLMEGSCC